MRRRRLISERFRSNGGNQPDTLVDPARHAYCGFRSADCACNGQSTITPQKTEAARGSGRTETERRGAY
jgi:hypothetical protein